VGGVSSPGKCVPRPMNVRGATFCHVRKKVGKPIAGERKIDPEGESFEKGEGGKPPAPFRS